MVQMQLPAQEVLKLILARSRGEALAVSRGEKLSGNTHLLSHCPEASLAPLQCKNFHKPSFPVVSWALEKAVTRRGGSKKKLKLNTRRKISWSKGG